MNEKIAEKPIAHLIGENGNIFNLMAIASRALESAGMKGRAEEMMSRIQNEAQSYDEALRIICEYVEAD